MISAIIPVSDSRYIKNQLELLKYKEVKELIILDSSFELKNKIDVGYDDRIIVVEEYSFDHGATRNKGAKLATGKILLFMTQDAKPEGEKFTEEIIKSIDECIKGVYARHVTNNQANLFEKIERALVYHDKTIIKRPNRKYDFKDIFISDVCFAVDRKVFEEVGGFPEKVICSEELILSRKILSRGFAIMYNPKIKVLHQHSENIQDMFKRWFDVGVAFSKNPIISSKFTDYTLKLVLLEFFIVLRTQVKAIPHLLGRNIVRMFAFELGKRHEILKAMRLDPRKFSKNEKFWSF